MVISAFRQSSAVEARKAFRVCVAKAILHGFAPWNLYQRLQFRREGAGCDPISGAERASWKSLFPVFGQGKYRQWRIQTVAISESRLLASGSIDGSRRAGYAIEVE
jgi:hypothetical protein